MRIGSKCKMDRLHRKLLVCSRLPSTHEQQSSAWDIRGDFLLSFSAMPFASGRP